MKASFTRNPSQDILVKYFLELRLLRLRLDVIGGFLMVCYELYIKG